MTYDWFVKLWKCGENPPGTYLKVELQTIVCKIQGHDAKLTNELIATQLVVTIVLFGTWAIRAALCHTWHYNSEFFDTIKLWPVNEIGFRVRYMTLARGSLPAEGQFYSYRARHVCFEILAAARSGTRVVRFSWANLRSLCERGMKGRLSEMNCEYIAFMYLQVSKWGNHSKNNIISCWPALMLQNKRD